MDIDEIEKWLDDPAKWLDTDASTWIEFDNEAVVAWLSENELTKAKDDLEQCRSSADFRKTVLGLCSRCGSSQFFNSPHCSFLRDAFVVAEFARHKNADRVRLARSSDQWPDGFVTIGGKDENVEVTIALMPGRRMGDEYRFDAKCELDPVHNRVKRAAAIPGALDDAIAPKIAKHYPIGTCLVVYLNIDDYGIRQLETEVAIAAVKQRHAASFGSIFVLWKDRLL
jgi:hypothetical protein